MWGFTPPKNSVFWHRTIFGAVKNDSRMQYIVATKLENTLFCYRIMLVVRELKRELKQSILVAEIFKKSLHPCEDA